MWRYTARIVMVHLCELLPRPKVSLRSLILGYVYARIDSFSYLLCIYVYPNYPLAKIEYKTYKRGENTRQRHCPLPF